MRSVRSSLKRILAVVDTIPKVWLLELDTATKNRRTAPIFGLQLFEQFGCADHHCNVARSTMPMKAHRLFSAAALLLAFTGSSSAQVFPPQLNPDQGLIRREERQARLAACAGRPAGAPCSFTTPRGRVVTSICAPNRRQILMCKPSRILPGFPAAAAPIYPIPH